MPMMGQNAMRSSLRKGRYDDSETDAELRWMQADGHCGSGEERAIFNNRHRVGDNDDEKADDHYNKIEYKNILIILLII